MGFCFLGMAEVTYPWSLTIMAAYMHEVSPSRLPKHDLNKDSTDRYTDVGGEKGSSGGPNTRLGTTDN